MTEFCLGEADAGRELTLRAGDLVRVELKENPTTGYLWSPTPETAGAFEIVSDQRVLGGAPGAASLRVFVFRVRTPGELRLELVLSRPWSRKDLSRIGFQISAA